MNDRERFLSKIDKSGCWLWTAAKTVDGYGLFSVRGKTMGAHRFSYEMFVGPIPDGLDIDHLCRMSCCVNPEHLEPVTHKQNVRRGRMPTQQRFKLPAKPRPRLENPTPRGAHNKAKTHCPKGHPYSEENTYYRKGNKDRRECRTCKRDSQKRWKRSKRDA